MSFKEQKIIRLWGRMVGDILTVAIVYKDGRTETVTYKNRRKTSPSPARRDMTA